MLSGPMPAASLSHEGHRVVQQNLSSRVGKLLWHSWGIVINPKPYNPYRIPKATLEFPSDAGKNLRNTFLNVVSDEDIELRALKWGRLSSWPCNRAAGRMEGGWGGALRVEG